MSLIQSCWDQSRGHFGPCCMDCIIEEVNRRGGTPTPRSTVRDIYLRHHTTLVLVVRACCHHTLWQESCITSLILEEAEHDQH